MGKGASLVAQTVKNLPAMQETWVWSLDWEDPLEKGTHGDPLQFSGLENSMDRRASWATVHGVTKSQTQLTDFPYRGKETSQGIMNKLPHLHLVWADGSLPA